MDCCCLRTSSPKDPMDGRRPKNNAKGRAKRGASSASSASRTTKATPTPLTPLTPQKILAQTWNLVRGLARSYAQRLGPHVRGEDLAAAAAPAILRRLANYDPARGAPTTFVHVIAMSVFRDEVRSRLSRARWLPTRSLAGLDAELLPATKNENGDPVAAAIRGERVARLHHLLALATPRQRQALTLRYLGGRTIRETAAAMAVSHQQISHLCIRGIRRIRCRGLARKPRRHHQKGATP